MAIIKSEYYRFNGSGWDLHYFRTSADLILETDTKKVLTADERTLIAGYLTSFNGPGQLVKVNGNEGLEAGFIPSSLIPPLAYLSLDGGSIQNDLGVAGAINVGGNAVIGGNLFLNGGIAADSGIVSFSGNDAIDMDGGAIINVAAPINAGDAANKAYVDGLVAVGVKPVTSVVAATTQNMSLSGLTGVDGITLTAGARVLVWKQTTASENGIYIAATGGWSKVAADSNQGAYVFVNGGNTYNDWYFYCTALGVWIDHARPDTVSSGAGLTKSGNTLSISSGGVTNAMLAGGITDAKMASAASDDDDISAGWAAVPAASTETTPGNHIKYLYNAIRLLRGQANYNTNNAQTITGAYALATQRNRTFVATGVPTDNSGYITGDLLFKTISST